MASSLRRTACTAPQNKPPGNSHFSILQMTKTVNNKVISFGYLQAPDTDELLRYLLSLNEETTKRFQPHQPTKSEIENFYRHPQQTIGFIARDTSTHCIIAYATIRTGYIDHDEQRLLSYGLQLSKQTDAAFAPSVADNWQGAGIGKHLLEFIITELKRKGVQRIILWGGVQAANERAIQYYKKSGFIMLGGFMHNGHNYDMLVLI